MIDGFDNIIIFSVLLRAARMSNLLIIIADGDIITLAEKVTFAYSM